MKKMLLAFVTLAALSSPALASQCPTLMTKIDEAMKTATVDDATKAQITELYSQGKTAHDAGDHPAAEKALNEALALLGM